MFLHDMDRFHRFVTNKKNLYKLFGHNKLCDIRLVIPRNDLLAGSRCPTFEEAVMQAIEALERQIQKKKTQ